MSFLFGNDKSKIKYDGDAAADLAALKSSLGGIKKVITKTVNGAYGSTYFSEEFLLDAMTRAMLVCVSANGGANGIINVNADSTGWVSTFPLVGASNQQITHAMTGQLKIENRTSSTCSYTLFVFTGDAE